MMKTPYDTAMRVQRRELDAMGVTINVQVNVLNQIETAQEELRTSVLREVDVAASDLGMSCHAYMERVRAEQDRLTRDGAAQRVRLDQLRHQAAAAYGSYRAIEIAAEGYREDANRRDANAEQTSIDDGSVAAFLKARRALRGAR
jgi:flagellar export protein FliJ